MLSHSAEIALCKGLKVYEILEQRLDLHVREIDFFLGLGSRLSSLRLNRSRLFSLLVGVQRLHCREFKIKALQVPGNPLLFTNGF